MIYIKKGRSGQFRVVYAGNNGEVLAVSESLKSKQSAWKNIKAMYPNCGVYVRDETIKKHKEYFFEEGVKEDSFVLASDPKCTYKF